MGALPFEIPPSFDLSLLKLTLGQEVYLKSDFKRDSESKIGSFGYTFYPMSGQKNGEKIKPKMGIILVQKRRQFSYGLGIRESYQDVLSKYQNVLSKLAMT